MLIEYYIANIFRNSYLCKYKFEQRFVSPSIYYKEYFTSNILYISARLI